ncbi:MAG: hypothetical protein KUL77_12400 [Thermomonas sp.]|uniref:hypothetical protein n=1 Tax=Thermomonas sp. TaxID=1971895 RepID=UPI001EC8AE58|nr:hypothetical protein [Thermomonas sp.]MBV2210348.1 hypothetical protein [Thermomonas sp.]
MYSRQKVLFLEALIRCFLPVVAWIVLPRLSPLLWAVTRALRALAWMQLAARPRQVFAAHGLPLDGLAGLPPLVACAVLRSLHVAKAAVVQVQRQQRYQLSELPLLELPL